MKLKLIILIILSILSGIATIVSSKHSKCFRDNKLTGFSADYTTFSINMSKIQSDGTTAYSSHVVFGIIEVDFENQLMFKYSIVASNRTNKYKYTEYTFGVNSTRYFIFEHACYIKKFKFKFPSSLQINTTSFNSGTTLGADIQLSNYQIINPNPLSNISFSLSVDDDCNFITLLTNINDMSGFSSTNFYYYYPNAHNPSMYTCENPMPLPDDMLDTFY